MDIPRNVYVDIPNPAMLGQDDNSWINVAIFAHTDKIERKTKAVEWIRENIGPCDDDGEISLISGDCVTSPSKEKLTEMLSNVTAVADTLMAAFGHLLQRGDATRKDSVIKDANDLLAKHYYSDVED